MFLLPVKEGKFAAGFHVIVTIILLNYRTIGKRKLFFINLNDEIFMINSHKDL